jgi:MYXO-CTERM domain-containing protein
LFAVAGLALLARGQANVVMEVSPAGAETWSNTIAANPGQSVDVRVRVGYSGTAQPLGLASMYFQPTISNWRNTGSVDVFGPLVNGGQGSNTSTPIGAVPDASGQYGRIIPFASRATNAFQTLTGFVQAVSSVTYLRVAQQYATDWIGQGLNTDGDRGVPITQLSNFGRTTSDPAFSNSLQNVVVFKFKITLSNDPVLRTMLVDAPAGGFGNLNTTTGVREVRWYGAMNESTGSIVGAANVTTATITEVPSPGVLALAGAGGLAALRRRKR